MARDIARAKREDKKMFGEHEDTRIALTRVFEEQHGQRISVSAAQRAVDQNFRKVNAMWMKRVLAKYQGSVIRRTVNSLDFAGNTISRPQSHKDHLHAGAAHS